MAGERGCRLHTCCAAEAHVRLHPPSCTVKDPPMQAPPDCCSERRKSCAAGAHAIGNVVSRNAGEALVKVRGYEVDNQWSKH